MLAEREQELRKTFEDRLAAALADAEKRLATASSSESSLKARIQRLEADKEALKDEIKRSHALVEAVQTGKKPAQRVSVGAPRSGDAGERSGDEKQAFAFSALLQAAKKNESSKKT